jgi:hypothetical protein
MRALRRPGPIRVVALVIVLGLVLAGAQVVSPPHSVNGFRIRAYPIQLAWYLLVLLTVAQVVRAWNAPRVRLLLTLAVVAALVIGANAVGAFQPADPIKVVFAALAGAAFVSTLERPWWLLPIALLVPVADAWSVFSSRGVTHAVVHKAVERPEWILWPTIATPIAGLPYASFGRLGIVDVLFAALFLGAATRWGWPVWRGVVVLGLALLATSVLVLEGIGGIAIPALPMICVAFLVAYLPSLVRDLRADWRSR